MDTKSVIDPNRPLCESCGTYFSNKSYLKTHIQIVHDRVKKFRCKYCDKCFSVKFSLKRHTRQVHTKTKPYNCSYCSLAFSDYTTRMKHERALHRKLRPYKCDKCSKCFAYSNVLKVHMRGHETDLKYTCALCSKDFTQKCNLETHLKRMHLMQGVTSSRTVIQKNMKPLEPLFIDTNLPQVMPFDAAFLPQIMQLHMPKVHVINLPMFPMMLNQTQPLKVFIANI